MKENFSQNWEKEFSEFLDTPDLEPPREISEIILATVSKDLHPPIWTVFLKLLSITAASSVLSLAICPQFGFGNNFWLMRFFMELGKHVCSVACGTIFIGLGVIISFLLLRPEELRVLRKTKLLQLSVLSMLSLSAFVCAGAEIFIAVAMFWMLGAVIGGLIILEVSYHLKFFQPSLFPVTVTR